MEYFDDKGVEEEERRNTAFTLLRALREIVTIARRFQQPISYEKAKDFLYDLDIDLYKKIDNLLPFKNESDIVKLYKELAKANSSQGEGLFAVTPESLLRKDIEGFENLLKSSEDKEYTRIKREILARKEALKYFEPKAMSEDKILHQDLNNILSNKYDYFKNVSSGTKQKDFELSDDRILRLRLYHPDKAERVTGTDLVYEFYDLRERKVRLIHLQYKLWDKGNLYLNSGNAKAQIEKMKSVLCGSGFCKENLSVGEINLFRFPHCCGFLRPTDGLSNSEQMKSSGYYIPICQLLTESENSKKLSRKVVSKECVSNEIFEDLFILNKVGSKWIPLDDLDRFYREKNLESNLENMLCRAQEVKIFSDEEIQRAKPK
jgi:hypothetical protein